MVDWKRKEREVAKKFNSTRSYLSGGIRQYGDVEHDTLYIEVKYRKQWSIFTLFDETAELAKKHKKIPLLVLAKKYSNDFIIVCKMSDIKTIAQFLQDK